MFLDLHSSSIAELARVDERAKRMVAFLAKSELDISLVTFHGLKQGDKILLARQVEVKARPPIGSVKSTKYNNQARLDRLLESIGIKPQYEKLVEALKQGFGASAYQWPNFTGYSFNFPEPSESGVVSNRTYVSVNASEKQPNRIQLYLHPRAIEAVGKDRLEQLAKEMESNFAIKPSGYGEIWVDGRKQGLEHTESLVALGNALAAGWKARVENQAKTEAEDVRDSQ